MLTAVCHYALSLLRAGNTRLSHGEDSEQLKPFSGEWITYVVVAVVLTVVAGMMSGLTLGLLAMDAVDLEVLKRSGTAKEKMYAERIMPVVKNQHLLLVVLLMCNAAAVEALPLFLNHLVHPVTAIILSVSVVLLFGEIVPQAICKAYGLAVGGNVVVAWLVRVLTWVLWPLAYPIGKLLDKMLGHDAGALMRRAQLKALVDIHGEGEGGTLSVDEIAIIQGALDLTSKTAWRSMTPLNKTFMLSTEEVLGESTLQLILLSGHSRIPVYKGENRHDIVGLLLVKDLILIDEDQRVSVSSQRLRPALRLPADTPLYDLLRLFEAGRMHMVILTKPTPEDGKEQRAAAIARLRSEANLAAAGNGGKVEADELPWPLQQQNSEVGNGEPVGIITIEDVIEELLQQEIVDETDLYVDNMKTTSVDNIAIANSLPPRLRKVLSQGYFTPRVGRLGSQSVQSFRRGGEYPGGSSGSSSFKEAAQAALQHAASAPPEVVVMDPATGAQVPHTAEPVAGPSSSAGDGLPRPPEQRKPTKRVSFKVQQSNGDNGDNDLTRPLLDSSDSAPKKEAERRPPQSNGKGKGKGKARGK